MELEGPNLIDRTLDLWMCHNLAADSDKPGHDLFMYFRLPFTACFVSDFLHTVAHTHTQPIFGNRFAAFLWFHIHFSTALEQPRAATLPRCVAART